MAALLPVTPSDLRAYTLFVDLPAPVIDELTMAVRRRVEKAGQRIMRAEESGQVSYLIASGTAKVCVETPDGSEVILSLLGPGELIGEMSLIDNDRRSATVEALEEMSLLAISGVTFERLLQQPAFARALMRLLTRRLRLTNARLLSLASQDVLGRIAYTLAVLAEEYRPTMDTSSVVIPLRLTQADLASLVGATRQSVNRVLVELTQKGHIATDRSHRVTVHNLAALERLSQR